MAVSKMAPTGRMLLVVCRALIKAVSTVVPHALRQDWRREWEAEVHYSCLHTHRRAFTAGRAVEVLRRTVGSLVDAVWLRCQTWSSKMLLEDVRYAVGGLVRQWRFTGTVVLIVALGVGANTAVFSVLDAVVLRPLPFPAPDQLVMIWDQNPAQSRDRVGASPANLTDWRERSDAFDGMAAWYAGEPVTLLEEPVAEKIQVATVTTDFFSLLRRSPVVGRTFTADETAAQDAVVVLSHGLWQRRFQGDASVVGQRITLDGERHTVVGVMPADFKFPNPAVELWMPWSFERSYARLGAVPRDFRYLRVVARLRSGVTLDQAQANLTVVAAGLADEYPAVNAGWTPRVVPLDVELVGDLRTALLVLFGAVVLVLLIACTNIANLLLARSSVRGREIAVRAALGASRGQLARLALVESLLLALVGGAAGLLVATVGLESLLAIAPGELPRLDEVAIDGRVLAFAAGLAVLTGLVFGLLPAIHLARPDLVATLKEGGRGVTVHRGARRFRGALVVAEIAAAFALLVGAGLLVESVVTLTRVDAGFETERLLVLRTFPDAAKYDSRDKRLQYFDELFRRLRSLPGVESVGAATGLPLNVPEGDLRAGDYNNTPARPYWRAGTSPPVDGGPQVTLTMATVGYFETMGIAVRGRPFGAEDHAESTPVVIVNETLAREVWPNEEAVGQRLVIDYARRGAYPYEVIGVARDLKTDGLRRATRAEAFMPHAQVAYVTMNVVVRTTGDPSNLMSAASDAVLAVDPTQPVHSVTTMDRLLATSLATDRFSMWLLGGLAALALALATSGIYGVMSYVVSQRQHEIGLRVALGAARSDVLGLVIGHAARLLVAGIGLGALGALALSRTLSALLYGVSPTSLVAFAGVPTLLVATALVASYLPARRAAGIDPIEVLRCD